SNLADVIADALLKADSAAEAALIAASSFNDTTLRRGSVNVDDVIKALAYRTDRIAVVKLTGAQVKKALLYGLSLYPQRNSAFLQVAGISATIDGSAPEEKRVVSVRIGGSPLEEKKTYLVAMPSPLAGGALNYQKIWGRADMDHET